MDATVRVDGNDWFGPGLLYPVPHIETCGRTRITEILGKETETRQRPDRPLRHVRRARCDTFAPTISFQTVRRLSWGVSV